VRRFVCLRCEWSGRTRRPTCPRCGVSLFRPARRKSRPEPLGSGGRESPALQETSRLAPGAGRAAGYPSRPPAHSEIDALSEPRVVHEGAGLFGAFVAPVAAIVVLALAWALASSPPSSPDEQPDLRAAQGTLAYAVDMGSGWQRLWLLDLASGMLIQGPRIPATSDLLRSYGGWIAFASNRPGEMKAAYVIRSMGPGDRPKRVARGDHVSWDPTGFTVVASRRSSGWGDCLRAVAVTVAGDPPWSNKLVLSQRVLCSDLLSIVRGEALTYYTRASPGRVGTFFVGFTSSRLLLHGYAVLSVSPEADLLLARVPQPKKPGLRPVAWQQDGPWLSGLLGPTALYRLGEGSPSAIRSEGSELRVGRVLAWSPDAADVLVLGELGEQLGVFLIPAAPDAESHEPEFVAEIGQGIGATFAGDGTAFLARAGRLFQVARGELLPVPLPQGAPPAAGPIVWIPLNSVSSSCA